MGTMCKPPTQAFNNFEIVDHEESHLQKLSSVHPIENIMNKALFVIECISKRHTFIGDEMAMRKLSICERSINMLTTKCSGDNLNNLVVVLSFFKLISHYSVFFPIRFQQESYIFLWLSIPLTAGSLILLSKFDHVDL